ncbi:MAG TPA: hypothetical protein VF546_03855 [Pyrinomonadaceae bacterium]|jgi:hypothetical protein
MSEPLIRDIPHIKKNLEQVEGVKSLKVAMPFLGPVLKLFGVDVGQMKEALAGTDELERMAEELSSIPDRFNDLFAKRGWIIYDFMNVEVAKAVITKAESGDIDGAEADLVDYYSPETVEWKLRTMLGIKAFHPRMPLAEKALDDYREGRYHACVPVVLALMDGLVNELHEKRRGFFAEEVDLQAWDSIAAHSKGLNALTRIFQTGRYKTTADAITLPYRNGILHGMDLGYDNKTVAAKTWAALFATRDWAVRAEQGTLSEQPEKPKKTWGELFQQIRENAEDRARIEAWKPRDVRLGEEVPVSGEACDYEEGTPEHALAEFLNYWKARNYGYMTRRLPAREREPMNKAAARLRENFSAKRLQGFEFQSISENAAALTLIEAKLRYEEDGKPVERSLTFRLINERADGSPCVSGKPGSGWSVYNWGAV